MELMQHTNLLAANTHFASPENQRQATYAKNGIPAFPGQIGYILCSRKHMGNMGRSRVLWNRSLDAHAERIDHGLARMFMRFRIKVHRKLPESARSFNRDALKSEENRELLNQAYVTARDEYDLHFPPLSQSILTAKTVNKVTSVFSVEEIRGNRCSEFYPATTRHTSSTPEWHPNQLRSRSKVHISPEIGCRREFKFHPGKRSFQTQPHHTSHHPPTHNPLYAEVDLSPENRDRGSEFPISDQAAEEAAQAKVNGMFNRLQAHSRRPAQRCHVTRNQNSFAGKYIPGSSRYQSVEEEPSPGLQNESRGQES